jgi:predicted dehydrogenase
MQASDTYMIRWRARTHQQCDSVLLPTCPTKRVTTERAGALRFVGRGHYGIRQPAGRPCGYPFRMTLRIGIVGCGAITAFAHVPALLRRRPGLAELAGLCDRNLQRAECVKQRFGLHAYCTHDPEKLLSDPSLDAVIVATWPSEHVQLALAAIDSGRHVLLQKPLTVDEKESAAIVSAAELTRLNVMALPIVSTVPSLSALKGVIDSGILGDIRYTRIRTSISGPSNHYQDVRRFFAEDDTLPPPILGKAYAQGGGCLSDMGPYALALFQYLYGEGELMYAVRNKSDFETAAVLNLKLQTIHENPASALCTIEVGWSQHSALEVCSVFGSQGAATVTVDGKLCLWPVTDGSAPAPDTPGSSNGVLPTSPVAGQDEWLDAIAANSEAAFVDSVRQAAWTANTIVNAYRMSGIKV